MRKSTPRFGNMTENNKIVIQKYQIWMKKYQKTENDKVTEKTKITKEDKNGS